MFALFVGMCLVPPLPLLALALLTDGRQATLNSLIHMSPIGLVCMLALGAISTSIAYWLWGGLLRDYPAAQVVPFALLVPFVGAAASTLVFGERFGPLRLSGMVVVVCGIAVMLLSKRPQVLPKIASVQHGAATFHRLCRVRHRDVFHAGTEQHPTAVVETHLRLPPHAA